MSLLQIIGYSLLVVNMVIGLTHVVIPRITTNSRILISAIVLLLINELTIFNKLNLVAVMNGAFSDLSITSIIISASILWDNLRKTNVIFSKIFSRAVPVIIFILGIILYLSVIGVMKFDIYDLGYEPTYLIIGFVLLEIFFLRFNKLFAVIWLCGLVGFYFNIQNSLNFWDYVFDPFLWTAVILLVALKGVVLLRTLQNK